MIPLGSCTMKLNAAAEMEPISWPEFSGLHPFAPAEQTVGFRMTHHRGPRGLARRADRLRRRQPAAERRLPGRAGWIARDTRLTTRDWGETDRTVCLVPSSAHGTNPASAELAGFDVVVVACTSSSGEIDRRRPRARSSPVSTPDRVGALMITYPSTSGIYDVAVSEICALVHDAGGQVYLDGANLNALIGVARLAELGADASHLNLHKTFCIPHGGGGPGIGPMRGARAPRAVPAEPSVLAPTPKRRSGHRAAARALLTARPASSRSRGPTCASLAGRASRRRRRWQCSARTTSRTAWPGSSLSFTAERTASSRTSACSTSVPSRKT